MSTDYEIRLVGASAPDGEIRLTDLAAIAESWQELSLRVGRAHVDAGGPGRAKRTIEELTLFRLRGLARGSTRLLLSRGPTEELDLELEPATQLEMQFWEVIEAIGTDRRPDWVSDLIADSAAELVSALRSAAPEVVRSHAFRIRDDAGNTIELNSVRDDEAVASYVGSYVTATGQAVLNRAGRFIAVAEPTLQCDDNPVSASRVPASVPLTAILEASPGPDPRGAVELNDDEFAAFLEAMGS